jgi:hypothetical protein
VPEFESFPPEAKGATYQVVAWAGERIPPPRMEAVKKRRLSKNRDGRILKLKFITIGPYFRASPVP